MHVFRKLLLAELAWALAIFLLMASVERLSEEFGAAQYVLWLARAIGIAAFPAGITVSGDVLAARSWRLLIEAVAAAAIVALVVSHLPQS